MGNGMVSARFLGCTVGGGCDPSFKATLAKVEAHLTAEYRASGLQQTAAAFAAWHGIRDVGGWRNSKGWHGKGKAIDLNYSRNGYPAMRSGRTYGGEAAGEKLGVRKAAIDACDRASQAAGHGPADLSGRRRGESIGAAYDRVRRASDDLRAYLGRCFDQSREFIRRRPVAPGSPIEAYEVMVESGELLVPLASVPLQMLEDYEAVRIPLVVGAPSKMPGCTRNPALGLLDIPRHVVVALVEVGELRWGGVEFGAGSSGDVMHFDAGTRYTV